MPFVTLGHPIVGDPALIYSNDPRYSSRKMRNIQREQIHQLCSNINSHISQILIINEFKTS
jgi:hypothetical protein